MITASALETADALMRDLLKPASRKEAGEQLEALFRRYPQFEDLGDESVFWREWLDDVAEWPADLLTMACLRWRRSPAKKSPATSGQLAAPIAKELESRRAFDERIKSALLRLSGAGGTPQSARATYEPEIVEGPWAEFSKAVKRYWGDALGEYRLHQVVLDGSKIYTAAGVVEMQFRRDLSGLMEEFGYELVFFPARFNKLTANRTPLPPSPPMTPAEHEAFRRRMRRAIGEIGSV